MLGVSLVTILHLLIAVPLCAHVLLRKDNEPVAVGWIALILLSPFLGAALYGLFGINRVERSARKLRSRAEVGARASLSAFLAPGTARADPRFLNIVSAVNDLPFLPGNQVVPLINGDQTYPAMLAAIATAKKSIALSTYIFDYDATGQAFVAALTAAAARGVIVRVLIDDVGLRYSPRAIDDELAKSGVTAARFIPHNLRFIRFFNLRNHRKIMVVDGEAGFIGGINIRHGNVLGARPRHPVQDIHFQVRGPVLDQMSALFEEDWEFATTQAVDLPRWPEAATYPGLVEARLAPAGPDHRVEKLQWLILGALAVSQRHVRIMTPYFIPNGGLVSALCVCALRGVEVEVLVPERSNIFVVDWATAANFEKLLSCGVKIYLNRPPFDHSKLMIVDSRWALVGSTNWDQRSLRLNFEANLECVDPALGAELERYFNAKKADAKPVILAEVQAKPLWIRLRNNFVRLFGSYL
ncbi:MAG: PLDc N-terminal domain-containing protein [Rhodospirillaceae bacterium]|nr:PLDc N-terminal domain-containing protein [Rhodospirillaceae bacterium]